MQVHVGNLSRHITDKEFSDLVSSFGKPDSLSAPRWPVCAERISTDKS
jgi:RNA recognition motif-containing protein